MTLINAWVNGETGYLATDTAILDGDTKKVEAFADKAFRPADFPSVVGVSFLGGRIEFASEPFTKKRPRNANQLRKMLPSVCRNFVKRARQHGVKDAWVNLTAVAWCAASKRLRVFYCSSESLFAPAYQAVDAEYWLSCGKGSAAFEAAEKSLNEGRGICPESELIPLCEAQRKQPFIDGRGDQWTSGCIGGELVLFTVNSENAWLQSVHKWPDVKGMAIAA